MDISVRRQSVEDLLNIESTLKTLVGRIRLQGGLAMGGMVIETGSKGRSMHLVSICRSHGKSVTCLRHPEEIFDHPKVQEKHPVDIPGTV